MAQIAQIANHLACPLAPTKLPIEKLMGTTNVKVRPSKAFVNGIIFLYWWNFLI